MEEKLTARLVGGTGGTVVKATQIALPADSWYGGTNHVWQSIVEIEDASPFSKIDLQPSAEQLEAMQQTGIALMAENANGIFTVYAFGDKPSKDLTLQATVTEVVRMAAAVDSGKICGNTVGWSVPLLYPKSR